MSEIKEPSFRPSLDGAVIVLQTPSSSLNDKIIALRYLKQHVAQHRELNDQIRSNINQLVLDTVLNIILSEDRTTDLRRRQLLRTECFLMLASLLGSQTLFRGIDQKLIKLAADQQQHLERQQQSQSRQSELPSSETKQFTPPRQSYDEEENDSNIEDGNEESFHSPQTKQSQPKPLINLPPGGWVRSPTIGNNQSTPALLSIGRRPPTSPTSTSNKSVRRGGPSMHMSESNDDLDASILSASASWTSLDKSSMSHGIMAGAGTSSMGDLSILKSTIAKPPRYLLKNKKLRPRPSIFFSSEHEPDSFVPGVDPTNWIEQDRKLGYQKPRMWFPTAAGSLDRKMVPIERNVGSDAVKPDRIVQEYLQMKAMLSYVGDLVMPYKGKTLTRTQAGATVVGMHGREARPLARLTGVVETNAYEKAMQEAVQVWTPLVGAHLPGWAKHPRDNYGTRRENDCDSVGGDSQYTMHSLASSSVASLSLASSAYSTFKPDPKDPNPFEKLEKAVLISQEVLKRFIKKEIKGAQATGTVLRETLQILTQDQFERDSVHKLQGRLSESLAEEKRAVEQSISALETLTKETIRLQYASLPGKYLLVVEGKSANPRVKIAKLLVIFCKHKRTNLLAMAMGVWKISLLEKARQQQTALYSKTAAVYLMKEWVINMTFRKMKKWTKRWRLAVRRMIFEQRNAAVLPLQTLYRRWRDRCTIIRMHLLGAYNGPLSDIYLGPWRPSIKFKIPKSIRTSRRMYWQATIQIQTRYRLFYLYRETRERRKKVILLQSVIRMWPKRMQFLRLRKWAIKTQSWMRRTLAEKKYAMKKIKARILQKYVRRYLGQLWLWRTLFKIWGVEERRMAAAILIQIRWREYWAKLRAERIRSYNKQRDWACLILQRQWYKQKNQYHTFVLICALRVSSEIDREFIRFVRNMRRYYCARAIQRVYAVRFFRRNLTSCIKLQCWWRGRLGYSLVDLRRKQLWASRKLHHWARGALKRKNARVRKIQRCWWNYKRGSLLMHLAWRARLLDERFDSMIAQRRYRAACILQAYVHAMWIRYWFKRHKAALRIQPPLRFFLARKRWKREKREQNHNKVGRFVNQMTARLLQRRVKQILKNHSLMMVYPQRLIRGWLVRRRFLKARKAAHEYGQAVLCIQRCYRKSGAMAAAVAHILAVRRADANPFRQCNTIHELLVEVRKKCNRLYNYRDPRVGIRVHSFLYRLGLPDLTPMFPKKEFHTLSDLQGMSMPQLLVLHDAWMDQLDKAARGRGVRDAGNKKKPKPLDQFQLILDTLKPAYAPRAPSQQALVLGLMSVQDCISPNECGEMVYTKFLKKFGENHVQKAHNWAEKLVNTNWVDYNHILGLGIVTTLRLIYRCLSDSTQGGDVASRMETFKDMFPDIAEDNKWDKRRVSECASLMQLAFERANKILEDTPKEAVILKEGHVPIEDPVQRMLDKVGTRVLSYKRKFGFMRERFVNEKQREAKEAAKNPNKVIKHVYESQWALPEDARDRILTVDESVDLPFNWMIRTVDQLDFEFNLSIAKLYQQTFDRLICATMGIQGIKEVWRRNSIRRVVRREREQVFLGEKSVEYLNMMRENHVQRVWLEFKRKETVIRQFQARLKEAEDRKALVLGLLKWIPCYGWVEKLDDAGYPYWQDSKYDGHEPQESSIDMPIYTYQHWKAVTVLQRRTQHFLEAIKERKRLKEVEKQRQLALIEEQWLEQLKQGQKRINFSLTITSNGINALIEREKGRRAAAGQQGGLDDDLTSLGSLGSMGTLGSHKEQASVASGGTSSVKTPSVSVRSAGGSQAGGLSAVGSGDQPPLPAPLETESGETNQDDAINSNEKLASNDATIPAPIDDFASSEDGIIHVSLSDLETRLPWHLKFQADPQIISGMWALLATPHTPSPPMGIVPYPLYSTNDYGIKKILESRAGSRIKSRGRSREGESDKSNQKPSSPSSKSRSPSRQAQRSSSRPEVGETDRDPPLPTTTPYKAISGGMSYEVVVVFKIRPKPGKTMSSSSKICTCRNVKGVMYDNISLDRLFLMNVEKDLGVECRYKRQRAFYRGVIANVTVDHWLAPRYSVRFDDGELETHVTKDMVRPSAASLDAWFDERNRIMKVATLTLKRLQHFARLRKARLARLQESAYHAERHFSLNWGWSTKSILSPTFQPPTEPLDIDILAAYTPSNQPEDSTAPGQSKHNRNQAYTLSAAAVPDLGTFDVLSGVAPVLTPPMYITTALRGMMASAAQLNRFAQGVRCSAKYNQVPFRYGWSVVRAPATKGKTAVLSFTNSLTGEQTDVLQVASHRASDEYYVRKLQSAWLVRKSRQALKTILYRDSVEVIAASAILRYKKISFCGYRKEGITALQTIRRAGFSEVASALETKFALYPNDLAAVTIDQLLELKADRYDSMGFQIETDIKALKAFQKWWNGTSPMTRDKSLLLINWYDVTAGWRDETDTRTMKQVLASGEQAILDKFYKQYPNALPRCQAAAKRITQESTYPVSFAMIDNYLKKYGDKADLATKENIPELLNKATISNSLKEKEALEVLSGATRRIGVLVGNMGIRKVRDVITAAEQQVQTMLKESPLRASIQACPGIEGRAAHLLRVKVMEYIQNLTSALRLIQRRVRGFVKKNTFLTKMRKRRVGVKLIQRWVRGCMDRAIAKDLRKQQESEWEQMWDPHREIVYFFNHVTRRSSYLEPTMPYRPLVRDRRSQALVQAWPHLDKRRAPELSSTSHAAPILGLAEKHATVAPHLTFCAICHVRRCVRLCTDCALLVQGEVVVQGVSKKRKAESRPMPFCFPCFTQAHGENTSISNHCFEVVNTGPSQGGELLCSVCDDSATRKCMGILDDGQIDDLCAELSRSAPKTWPSILQKASVGGERKLMMILEEVLGSGGTGSVISRGTDGTGGSQSPEASPAKATSSSSVTSVHSAHVSPAKEDGHSSSLQMQKVRQVLERTRAECDECYCDDCYKEIHSGGKRSLHRWQGFSRNAPVCTVCTRSPAMERCIECNSGYCSTCFKVFHAMGRKRKHRHEKIRDELYPGQEYCVECDRRAGVTTCSNEGPPKKGGGVSKFMDAMEADRGLNTSQCGKRCCEACFECIHKPMCDAALASSRAQREAEAARKEAQRVAKDPNAALLHASASILDQKCVACEEPADQKCVQCGDTYCSKTWMGNPGCFAKYHAKGKRAEHTTVSLESLLPAAGPPGGASAWAKGVPKRARPT